MLRDMMMLMKKAASVTYATWNPADKNAAITLSNGNLTATSTAALNQGIRSTIGKSSGKWYWEVTGAFAGNWMGVGVADTAAALTNWIGIDGHGTQLSSSGNTWFNSVAGAGTTFVSGDVIGVALDMDARTLSFYKNNVLQATLSSARLPTGTLYAAFSSETQVVAATVNFGATPFVYSPPAGYNAGLYV